MVLFYLFAPVQRRVSWTTLQFSIWLASGSWVSFYWEYAIFSFRPILNLEPHSPEFNKPDFCFCNDERVCLNEDWPSWNATQAVRQSKHGSGGMGGVSSTNSLLSGQVMSPALLVLALHGGARSCACLANMCEHSGWCFVWSVAFHGHPPEPLKLQGEISPAPSAVSKWSVRSFF